MLVQPQATTKTTGQVQPTTKALVAEVHHVAIVHHRHQARVVKAIVTLLQGVAEAVAATVAEVAEVIAVAHHRVREAPAAQEALVLRAVVQEVRVEAVADDKLIFETYSDYKRQKLFP